MNIVLIVFSIVSSSTNYNFIKLIGKGALGKVWKVSKKKDNTLYAMKKISKLMVLATNNFKNVINELEFLKEIRNESNN